MGDDIAGTLYYTIFLIPLLGWMLVHYRDRMSEAFRHAGIWVIIVLLIVVGYSFRGELAFVGNRIKATFVPGAIDNSTEGVIKVFSQDGDHFEITASVNGSAVDFLFDTGATITTLSRDAAEGAGIDTGALNYNVPFSTANGTRHSALTQVESFAIGDFMIYDLTVAVFDEVGETNLLGTNVINRFNNVSIEGSTLVLYYR